MPPTWGSAGAAEPTFVMDAVETSKAVGKPEVLWTREDDMQHDYYGPEKVWGSVDANGRPRCSCSVSWAVADKGIGRCRRSGATISLDGAANLPDSQRPGCDTSTPSRIRRVLEMGQRLDFRASPSKRS